MTLRRVTLPGLVRRHAIDRGDHPYLHFDGATITFAELDERTNRVAAGLVAAGVRPGDRVALLDKNGPHCFDVMFAAAKCGAVYVPLNWRLAGPEIAAIMADASPAVVFVGAEFVPLVRDIAHSMPSVGTIVVMGPGVGVDPGEDPGQDHRDYDTWADAQAACDPAFDGDADTVVLLMYTSGTTGRPKGAMLTNSCLLGRMGDSGAVWRYDADSVQLVVMPLFHIGGTSIALSSIVPGATTVLMREVEPVRMLSLIPAHGVTNMLLVPAIIQFLLDSPGCADTDWSSVRTLIYGAAPISDTVLLRAMAVMRCDFVQIYGMTEHSGCVACLPAEDHDPTGRPELLRSCGKPFPWVEVSIVDPSSGARLGPGEIGEIWARSDQLMLGYWHQDEATAAALTPRGWLRTGDVGYLDDDGYLYLHDRIKDMVISGGENIYPAEIENVLMCHPSVVDAAVIAVPHPRWGETPKAVVVAAGGSMVTDAEIISFCRTQLAGFKCPTSVEFVDILPRNPSGKLLKRELREPYWSGHTRRVG